jgi:predicted nucleic acid-binding Zn ribbon protein
MTVEQKPSKHGTGGQAMRLIDADDLKTKGFADEETGEGIVYVQDIDEAPTIEPEDLRPKGRWEKSGALLECQNCGEFYSQLGGNAGKAWNYCPNCGARMEETNENHT